MIFGHLLNADYSPQLPPVLAKICDYLNAVDLTTLEIGKHYLTEDIVIHVSETALVASEEKEMEFHQKNIDIQVLIEGEEWIEYSLTSPDLNNASPYNKDEDYQLISTLSTPNYLHLHPNMFAIFFPNECHKPCCYPPSNPLEKVIIKKLVVKVPIYLLEEKK